jgi:DNA-binding MarR family transcriptional regulator
MKIEEAIKQTRFKSPYERAVVNIFYTSNWLAYQEMSIFKEFDLSLPQFNVLRILKGQHPKSATVNLIIDRMLDKSSNASRIVEKLRQKGLVERTTCEKDRRRVDVVITDKGLDTVKKAGALLDKSHHKLQTLTDAEAIELSRLLDKLRTTEGTINSK